MAANEGALRRKVEETQAKVDELRKKYRDDPSSKQVGRQLLKAREKASEALAALWAACPDEKPPTQQVI